jgi:hypothetical protein
MQELQMSKEIISIHSEYIDALNVEEKLKALMVFL